jgi:hypothetical protein
VSECRGEIFSSVIFCGVEKLFDLQTILSERLPQLKNLREICERFMDIAEELTAHNTVSPDRF